MTDWADKSAARRNARQQAELPLLALSGDLEPIQAQDLRAQEVARVVDVVIRAERMERRGQLFRAAVARRVNPQVLADLDAQRRVAPPAAEFTADHWRGILARLLDRSPASKRGRVRTRAVWP